MIKVLNEGNRYKVVDDKEYIPFADISEELGIAISNLRRTYKDETEVLKLADKLQRIHITYLHILKQLDDLER